MIKSFWDEEWTEIVFDEKISEKEKFKISNYGRIINCKGAEEFLMKKKYFINGYEVLPLRQKVNGKGTCRYVHKVIAEHFLERKDGIYVIHLNYEKTDNHIKNLQWATKIEKEKHQFNNPNFVRTKGTITYSKLTETKVRLIKRKINDPNRRTRMKIIAKQFGVSEMQLYRIKNGENWGHVTEKNT